MQGSWSRASTVSVVGTVLAILGLLLSAVAPVVAGTVATCDYTASTHRVEVVVTGSGLSFVSENGMGQIHVNGVWCENTATVNNTDRIVILAGAGDQTVNVFWNGQGFKPGFTNESGDSDEIEFSVSLGGGEDKLTISAAGAADNIRAGLSSGVFVAGKVNLNAAETTGIDADITLTIGIERLRISGSGGSDIISGAGGAGTGDPFALPMELSESAGDDTLTGGKAGDQIFGGFDDDTLAGGGGADSLTGGADSDTMKGGGGPDHIHGIDGVSGNDEVFGGKGADICEVDLGDTMTSC